MTEWHMCEHCYTDFPRRMLQVFEYMKENVELVYLCDDCSGSLEQDAPYRRVE